MTTAPSVSRRGVMKAVGVGLLSLGGPVVSHVDGETLEPNIDVSAETFFEARLIPANPEAGFNYPYFLYAPKPESEGKRPIMINPNNSGEVTDNYAIQRKSAGDYMSHEGTPAKIFSKALKVPLMMPVFPRPEDEPVDWRHLTHALDSDTMEISEGPLERIDKQVLNMAEHAKSKLEALDYPVNDDLILDGFSASGNFVNRLAALHPERFTSVTAGAINGTAILPIEQAKGHTLDFPIGVANFESLIGEEFNVDAFKQVTQLNYMGAVDENDTIPYGDAWNEDEREVALDVYGEDMQDDRMPYCESVYDEVDVDATFKVYDGVGHSYNNKIKRDIIQLHGSALDLSVLEITEPVTVGEKTVTVSGRVFGDKKEGTLALRVFSDSRGELTESPVTIKRGFRFEYKDLPLAKEVQANETITVAALETDASSISDALITDSITDPVNETFIEFAEPPQDGDLQLSIRHAVKGTYEKSGSEEPINIRMVVNDEPGSNYLRATDPGVARTETVSMNRGWNGVPLSEGDTIKLIIIDRHPDSTGSNLLASTTRTVQPKVSDGETSGEELDMSVKFAEQPRNKDTEIAVNYTLDEQYNVQEFVSLELQIAGREPIHLDVISPGDSGRATYAIPQNPLPAGEQVKVSLVDDSTLTSQQQVVVVQEDATVEVSEESEEDLEKPTAVFDLKPDAPRAGETVQFTALDSGSPNGEILTYAWQLGENETEAGELVSHTFEQPGNYTVQLRIVDEEGQEAIVDRTVKVRPNEEVQTPTTTSTSNELAAAGAVEEPASAESSLQSIPGSTMLRNEYVSLGSIITGIGGVAYGLKHRVSRND